MEELINHPDKEINEIIEKHFPNKKPSQSTASKERESEAKGVFDTNNILFARHS